VKVGSAVTARSGCRQRVLVAAPALRTAAGLAISGGLLVLALRQVNLAEVWALLQQARYLDLAAAVAVYFVDLGVRSLRWQVLLGRPRGGSLPLRRLYPPLAIGYMMNCLLPGRLGDLSRAYLVGRREELSASTVLASVAIERILDGVTVLLLLCAALAVQPATAAGHGVLTLIAQLAAVSLGFALVGCVALVIVPGFWRQLASGVTRRLPDRAGLPLGRLAERFIDGFAVLADPAVLVPSVALSVAIWGIGATTYALVAAAFDSPLSASATLISIGAVNLATAIPLAPAGLGAFEAVAEQSFVFAGLASTTAFAVAIVLHTVLFVPVVLAGLLFLWRTPGALGGTVPPP
jgi:uncharacterized protein (TIRG00374 family)